MTIISLVFYAHVASIAASIRYGFLADAFAKRNVPGKVYGLIGTSVFVGFAADFFFKITETFLTKWNSRKIIAGSAIGLSIITLVTGFVYRIPNTTAVVAISITLRMIHGVLGFATTLVPVDFINANFPQKFDMVNGLVNMGYFSGHGVAELLGCILYDNYGYEVAFAFAATMALLAAAATLCFLPNTQTYLSIQGKAVKVVDSTDDPSIKDSISNQSQRLSKFLVFPLIATMLINANYGVIQVCNYVSLHRRSYITFHILYLT